MDELGGLVVGLVAGGALGYWLHTWVWAVRDARALRRWNAEASGVVANTDALAPVYGRPNVRREPAAWRSRIAQQGVYDYPGECEERTL